MSGSTAVRAIVAAAKARNEEDRLRRENRELRRRIRLARKCWAGMSGRPYDVGRMTDLLDLRKSLKKASAR